jgi:hypothetical protein
MYQIPKSQASIKQNRFEFTVEGSDKTYSVPLLKFLPVASVIAFEDEKQLTGILLAADPATKKILESLTGEQLEGLTNAWAEESGISQGE